MKGLCVLLVAVCLLTLSGCGGAPASSDPVSDGAQPSTDPGETLLGLNLAYSHDDTLNPFAAATEANLNLAGLLYDSLTALDEAFVPQLSLAAKVDTPDPTHLVVTLRQGAVFSDGSPVTAEDVVTSFKQAKTSANYKELLQNVADAAGKQQEVTFTLASPDSNASACLSFPVVKGSTLTEEKGKAPVGGGVYVYETTATGARLVANAHSTESPHYRTVGLRHLPNSTNRYYALSSGDITYYFDDLNSGDIPRVTGANVSVDMNALVFLGINGSKDKLADAPVRRALSALLDRPAMVSTAYSGWAVASQLPFHPRWQPVAELDQPDAIRDLDSAVEQLELAGCTAGSGGTRLSLELIYCTANSDRGAVAELIRSQMEGGGVVIQPVALEEAEYLARLKAGKYDLYVGEIRLTADMSLRPLLAGGSAGYGIARQGAAAATYAQYLSGECTLESFLQTFAADMPYIPLCWRSGFAAYDRRLTNVTPTGYAPYYGIAGWK